jgi:hypothetical protein
MPAIAARYPVLSYCRTIALASPAPLAKASGSESKESPRTLSISTSLPAVTRATNVCIFGDLDTWVNEVTFGTAAEPAVLKSSQDLATYVDGARGNWLIIWERDYAQLPVLLQEKLKVIDRQEMVQKKIVIGAFSNKDRIRNLNKLILARTR